ncbi:MAG: hypothetical protein K0R00_2249 [Herbinix sp.]|jgi:DNA polymerase-3 subunit epsilon|nr:hypothetical protein [Herbinix sp.]
MELSVISVDNLLTSSRFTFVDVETPNYKNDSICSIGVICQENGQELFSQYFLVNPEAKFDYFNTKLHGITPKIVENALPFSMVWEEIKEYFTNAIVVAHNATFDLSVISKALNTYGITVSNINYICTVAKARRHISKEIYGSFKLDVLSKAFQIELEQHHNAMCDTIACKGLFNIFADKFGIDNKDVKIHRSSGEGVSNPKKSVVHKPVNIISGLGYGSSDCFELNLQGKVCCLSGNFVRGSKSDVEALIVNSGGSCVTGLNKSVDYLIVGGQGSGDWKYGNYGAKIRKALEMQEKGSHIVIVKEESLFKKVV